MYEWYTSTKKFKIYLYIKKNHSKKQRLPTSIWWDQDLIPLQAFCFTLDSLMFPLCLSEPGKHELEKVGLGSLIFTTSKMTIYWKKFFCSKKLWGVVGAGEEVGLQRVFQIRKNCIEENNRTFKRSPTYSHQSQHLNNCQRSFAWSDIANEKTSDNQQWLVSWSHLFCSLSPFVPHIGRAETWRDGGGGVFEPD